MSIVTHICPCLPVFFSYSAAIFVFQVRWFSFAVSWSLLWIYLFSLSRCPYWDIFASRQPQNPFQNSVVFVHNCPFSFAPEPKNNIYTWFMLNCFDNQRISISWPRNTFGKREQLWRDCSVMGAEHSIWVQQILRCFPFEQNCTAWSLGLEMVLQVAAMSNRTTT